MPKVFISYSVKDEELAQWLYRSCRNFEIDTFLASISLDPGDTWKESILESLRESKWFFFLATENSIKSKAVMHEIGGALAMNKNIIPILHGIDFSDLPSWISDKHGVSLSKESSIEEMKALLAEISDTIKSDKTKGLLIMGGIVVGLALFAK